MNFDLSMLRVKRLYFIQTQTRPLLAVADFDEKQEGILTFFVDVDVSLRIECLIRIMQNLLAIFGHSFDDRRNSSSC